MAIKVELEELRDEADDFGNKAEEQQSLIDECTAAVEGLADIWEGSSQEAFLTQWEGLAPELEKAVELLEQIKEQLNGVADTMEETDEEMASQMNQ